MKSVKVVVDRTKPDCGSVTYRAWQECLGYTEDILLKVNFGRDMLNDRDTGGPYLSTKMGLKPAKCQFSCQTQIEVSTISQMVDNTMSQVASSTLTTNNVNIVYEYEGEANILHNEIKNILAKGKINDDESLELANKWEKMINIKNHIIRIQNENNGTNKALLENKTFTPGEINTILELYKEAEKIHKEIQTSLTKGKQGSGTTQDFTKQREKLTNIKSSITEIWNKYT